VVVSLFVLTVSLLASQQPSPGPAVVERGESQQHVAQEGQVSSRDQRDTRNARAEADTKIPPPTKTHKKPDQAQPEQQEQSAADWWMVRLTALLALIGAVQAAILGVQVCVYRQMRDHTKIIERAWVGIHQVELMDFGPTKSPTLVLHLKNSGRLPATIIDTTQTLLIGEPLPPTPEHTGWVAIPTVTPPGEGSKTGNVFEGRPIVTEDEWRMISSQKMDVFVYGAIRYLDGFGRVGVTAFGLRYEPAFPHLPIERRLVAANVPGYNYMT
jgi:hypothetical protein